MLAHLIGQWTIQFVIQLYSNFIQIMKRMEFPRFFEEEEGVGGIFTSVKVLSKYQKNSFCLS